MTPVPEIIAQITASRQTFAQRHIIERACAMRDAPTARHAEEIADEVVRIHDALGYPMRTDIPLRPEVWQVSARVWWTWLIHAPLVWRWAYTPAGATPREAVSAFIDCKARGGRRPHEHDMTLAHSPQRRKAA